MPHAVGGRPIGYAALICALVCTPTLASRPGGYSSAGIVLSSTPNLSCAVGSAGGGSTSPRTNSVPNRLPNAASEPGLHGKPGNGNGARPHAMLLFTSLPPPLCGEPK